MQILLGNVSSVLQSTIAPALLLVGVGTHIRVLNHRLARIVDRRRVLEQQLVSPDAWLSTGCEAQLDIIYRRMHLIHRAITLGTICALLICLIIAALFVTDVFDMPFDYSIAVLFVLSMMTLIGSFIYFLREIFFAINTLPVWLRRGGASKGRHPQ
jgi:hypothetical protein